MKGVCISLIIYINRQQRLLNMRSKSCIYQLIIFYESGALL